MLEHKTHTLADQVFERLEEDILSGKFSRGEILIETELCESLGVSRTPVREALRRLQQEHLVEEHGKGLKVLGIATEDLEDIMEIRLRLEGLAAARAAARITDEELNELSETLDLQEFYLTKQQANHIKGMDSKFHELIYKFSGSLVIYDTLLPLHKKVQRYRQKSVESSNRAVLSVEEHRKIYNALAARDPKAAEEAILNHTRNAKKHIGGE